MKLHLLISLLLLSSCSRFVEMTDGDYKKNYSDTKSNKLSILFSGNINGETHPCGCRKFPRGGIPQVYAFMQNLEEKNPYFYVDVGDTFFPLPQVSPYLKKSSEFTAKKIAAALDKLKLQFLTPGDNDFAMGETFLADLAKDKKFQFLISNASKEMKLKHLKLGHVKFKNYTLYFIGIVDPRLMPSNQRNLFTSPEQAIKDALEEIKKDTSSQKKEIFLLSHSGLEQDEIYAKKFPQIKWILGSHSQSFIQQIKNINETYLSQVLNRNHFLGKITLNASDGIYAYKMAEMKEELQDSIKNNPMIPWLQSYKAELEKIQAGEQNNIEVTADHKYIPSYISCSECHSAQVDFWQGTAHSLAFQTLLKNQAAYNTTCIGCHSVGYKDAKGFLVPDKIVLSDKKDFNIKKYWDEFTSEMIPKTVRDQDPKTRKEYAKRWLAFDKKKSVTHNFSNVQCLNCHNQSAEHPFDFDNKPEKMIFKNACITCHTPDQSPSWYEKNTDGLASQKLNSEYFSKKLKQVSCPKIERN